MIIPKRLINDGVNRPKEPKEGSAGFTIVQLLIATAVFSFVLLLCTTALLQITRLYYKGITSARTQEVARQVMDEISRNVQFGSGPVDVAGAPPAGGGPNFVLCIGASKRYSFVKGLQLSDDAPNGNKRRNVLVVDNNAAGTCLAQILDPPVVPALAPGSRELLATNMSIADLKIEETALGSKQYKITLRILSGDEDVTKDTDGDSVDDSCEDFRFGTQFCATADLSTVVKKRVK
jgi:hypothetical protein